MGFTINLKNIENLPTEIEVTLFDNKSIKTLLSLKSNFKYIMIAEFESKNKKPYYKAVIQFKASLLANCWNGIMFNVIVSYFNFDNVDKTREYFEKYGEIKIESGVFEAKPKAIDFSSFHLNDDVDANLDE